MLMRPGKCLSGRRASSQASHTNALCSHPGSQSTGHALGKCFRGWWRWGVQVAAQGDEGPVPASKAPQAGWPAIHLPLK